MPGKPSTAASDFIAAMYGAGSAAPVFLCALPNERGGHKEKYVVTRERAAIDGFVTKWDRPGSAIYFCTGTIRPGAQPRNAGGSVRCKENVAEILTLQGDTDLKSVEVDRAGLLAALLSLEFPPSVINWSGRGAHSYWLLNEALEADDETIARIEALNAQIADLIAGDAVQDVSRLMRLPGSHNTKDGAWLDVETVHARFEPRYELEDLEEWLSRASPVIRKKVTEKAAARAVAVADNPWLAVAERLGFKPPIDVEQRLSAMDYQGVGETSIHQTQIQVSAALLSRGEPVEDVVEVLLAATRAAAGEMGARWNWTREERSILRMCEDWRRKRPEVSQRKVDSPKVDSRPKAQAKHSNRGDSLHAEDETIREASTGAVVHSIAEERERREKKPKKRKAGDPSAPVHVVVGTAVIEAMRVRGQAVIFMRKAAWIYNDGLWTMETDGLKGWLDVQVETACRALGIESTNRTVGEARQWIQRDPDLWREDVPWDGHGKIPTRSGLVDPKTLQIEVARPEHYCTWRVEADYDPNATAPFWQTMVEDTFADRSTSVRTDTVGTIQEILGCALIDSKPRALSKAMCLVGGSNFGKSGILEVCSGLFGRNVISADLQSLEGTHGMMPFLRRSPWVLHEAFDQSKWHFSSVVKAIITSEPVQINVKSGPLVTARLHVPIFWGTNHPPQFREATRAIVNRFVIIECRRMFQEGQFVGVAVEARRRGLESPSSLVLQDERSGLLNWAIAGLQRAQARGAIAVTSEMTETADEIHRDSNLAAGFIEECCDFDMDKRVAVPDFCAAFAVWWVENKGEDRRSPSNEAIGKAVVALADRRIASNPKELRDKYRRYYAGLILNERGVALWKRASEAKLFEGKLASTTPSDEPVNSWVPDGWQTRSSVIAMRVAQTRVTDSGDSSVLGASEPVTRTATVTSATVTGNLSPELSPTQLSPTQATDNPREPQF